MDRPDRIELRDFDGDLAALFELTRAPFSKEYGGETWIDLYQPETARHLFAGVPDPRFLIGAYAGTRLVGFVANLPRTYRFQGQTYRGVVSTMLVTDRTTPGVAVYLIGECLKRNQAYGADLAVIYFERNHSARRLFEMVPNPQYPIQRLKRMHMLARAIDLERIVESEGLGKIAAAGLRLAGNRQPIVPPRVEGTVRPYEESDLDPILDLLERVPDDDCLVRVFDRDSLAIQLQYAGAAATIVYERDGQIRGLINFAVRDFVTRQGLQRWAWVEYVYFRALSGREKKALLAGLWKASHQRDCIGIMEWNKNSYEKNALVRARFVPYPRHLEMNAWVFDASLCLEGVSRVFEQVI